MIEIRLFRTGSGDKTFLWFFHKNPKCDVCSSFIDDPNALLIIDFHKKGRVDTLMHYSCTGNYKKHPLSVVQNRFQVFLTEVVPPGGVPVFIQQPVLSPLKGDASVFEPDKLRSDKTLDLAVRSKRFPSLEGAVIGDPLLISKILEDDDKVIMIESKKGGRA